MKLTKAGQPEILRAAQRDDTFLKQFNENVSEVLQSIFGIHFWIKYKEAAKVSCNIFYQLLTTMSNLQTLGEEYTGMVQVNSSLDSLPKKYLQLLMIILKNLGEKSLNDFFQKLKKSIENLPEEHALLPSARLEIIRMLNVLKICLPLLIKFHKALFYLDGDYYEFSKRWCGIKYALVRFWLKDRSSIPAFKILGTVSLLHSSLHLLLLFLDYKNVDEEKEKTLKVCSEINDVSDKCSLCLNPRQYSSVTPCGHLFCWPCIILWLQEQPKCPLCRQVFQPSRVVFLQN